MDLDKYKFILQTRINLKAKILNHTNNRKKKPLRQYLLIILARDNSHMIIFKYSKNEEKTFFTFIFSSTKGNYTSARIQKEEEQKKNERNKTNKKHSNSEDARTWSFLLNNQDVSFRHLNI